MSNRVFLGASLLWLACFSGCLTGCQGTAGNVAVPSSHLKMSVFGEPQDLTLPKDESIDELTFYAHKGGTNFVELKLRGLKAANNTDVIAAAFAGNLATLKVQGEMLANALDKLTSILATLSSGAKFAAPIPAPMPMLTYPNITYPAPPTLIQP